MGVGQKILTILLAISNKLNSISNYMLQMLNIPKIILHADTILNGIKFLLNTALITISAWQLM